MAKNTLLYLSNVVILVIVLLTNYSSGFFIRQQSVLTDIEPTEQKNNDQQRKNLIDVLQNLIQINFKEEKQSFDAASSFQLKTERSQLDSSVDKRDYGIMPPWNEMCRMMRVAFCVRHRR